MVNTLASSCFDAGQTDYKKGPKFKKIECAITLTSTFAKISVINVDYSIQNNLQIMFHVPNTIDVVIKYFYSHLLLVFHIFSFT